MEESGSLVLIQPRRNEAQGFTDRFVFNLTHTDERSVKLVLTNCEIQCNAVHHWLIPGTPLRIHRDLTSVSLCIKPLLIIFALQIPLIRKPFRNHRRRHK